MLKLNQLLLQSEKYRRYKNQSYQLSKMSKTSIKPTSNQAGFTIVEVLLAVLIGGIIVTLALAGFNNLRKRQNDNARKTVVAAVIAAVEEYRNNRGGEYPKVWNDIQKGLKDIIKESGIYDSEDTGNTTFNVAGSWRSGQPAAGKDGEITKLDTITSLSLSTSPSQTALNADGAGKPTDDLEKFGEDQIFVVIEATCDPGNRYINDYTARRSVAVFYRLESNQDIVCRDS